jgi:DNA-binding SARP family transcriptional activator
VDYRILGTFEVHDGERELELGGAKQRALLVVVLLNANRVVSTDRLIDELWGEQPPAGARHVIQVYVSELRKALEPNRSALVTRAPGYLIRVEAGELDLERFERLLEKGREALNAGDAETAAADLRAALDLWRGAPLADFTYEPFAQGAIARLEELRLAAVEDRIEADLALGRHADLVGEVRVLISEHPLREGFRRQLMLALYRSGRQAEALEVHQQTRQVLVDELGIDPSPALQRLEHAILNQDSALEFQPPGGTRIAAPRRLALLFTDIEGSTRLLHRLGEGYAEVLGEHRRLLRDAFERFDGRVVDSYGDCFFVTFDEPNAAAEAASAAQQALASYPWPDGLPVRVRIGIHSGEPVRVGSGYVGLDVHRAARICAAAHGGQILLSRESAAALTAESSERMSLRDLGEHPLKDLAQPEQLFQLLVEGLSSEFGPVRVAPGPPVSVAAPERSILISSRGDQDLDPLVAVAEPLARSQQPHELILTRLVEARQTAPREGDHLGRASGELMELRAALAGRGVAARVAAFTSAAWGDDLARLASEQAVDLVLLGAPTGLIGDGALDADLAAILTQAPSDVALCPVPMGVDRTLDQQKPVYVPFVGSEHDWAALELGAWVASANEVSLKLLGVGPNRDAGKRDASRLLATASLAVQQLVGIPAEPMLVSAGAEAILEATVGAALVVVGLSDRWRDEGFGPVRTAIVERAAAPALLVRRGVRPGGLAPLESSSRFTWSLSHVGSS